MHLPSTDKIERNLLSKELKYRLRYRLQWVLKVCCRRIASLLGNCIFGNYRINYALVIQEFHRLRKQSFLGFVVSSVFIFQTEWSVTVCGCKRPRNGEQR